MKKVDIYENIKRLITNSNLGNKVIEISKVTGGLSHRMYKVVTDKGNYAIKELNSNIMKRPEAYSNFIFSEKVIDTAKENGISAVGAMRINGDVIQKVKNNHYMVFEWIDGKVLKAEEITEKHSEIMGKILAQIHNIDFSEMGDKNRQDITIKEFDWKKYWKKAEQENKAYSKLLKESCDLLYELNRKANEAMLYANHELVISHRDLDRKNVIWKESEPFMIDWEASGYINPTIELIATAWYWASGDRKKILVKLKR